MWRTLCLYRAHAPAAEVVAASREAPDAQRAVLAAVADAACAAHPPAPGYARRVLKAALLAAEEARETVSDALADAYAAELLQPEVTPEDAPPWLHKTLAYAFAAPPPGAPATSAAAGSSAADCDTLALGTLTLRCSANLLAGATGCATWEAGLALAEIALSAPHAFAARRVLELGSGAGASAVALARAAPAGLLCTDGSEAALANLRHNLTANGVPVEQPEAAPFPDASRLRGDGADGGGGADVALAPGVRLARLEWEALTPQAAAELAPDVVVGADLIYDPIAVPALLRCVTLLLSRGAHDGTTATGLAPPPAPSAVATRPEALLVSLLRQESSMAVFMAAAADAGLHLEDATSELMGTDCGSAGADADAALDALSAGTTPPPTLPPGAVRFCHLPRGALPRRRLRVHRLRLL